MTLLNSAAAKFFIARMVRHRRRKTLAPPKVVADVKQHRDAKDGAAHGAGRCRRLDGRVDGRDAARLHDGLAGAHVVHKRSAHDVATRRDGRGANVATRCSAVERDLRLEPGAVRLRDDVFVVADRVGSVRGELVLGQHGRYVESRMTTHNGPLGDVGRAVPRDVDGRVGGALGRRVHGHARRPRRLALPSVAADAVRVHALLEADAEQAALHIHDGLPGLVVLYKGRVVTPSDHAVALLEQLHAAHVARVDAPGVVELLHQLDRLLLLVQPQAQGPGRAGAAAASLGRAHVVVEQDNVVGAAQLGVVLPAKTGRVAAAEVREVAVLAAESPHDVSISAVNHGEHGKVAAGNQIVAVVRLRNHVSILRTKGFRMLPSFTHLVNRAEMKIIECRQRADANVRVFVVLDK